MRIISARFPTSSPISNVPIYGTQFTLALVRKKLEEHGLLDKAKLHEVAPGQTTTLGPFQIEYLHVTHSTIDCVALAIRTPLGVIIHTGDFKIDPTPVDGKPFDLHAFARYGQEGVLALFSDSTNVERPGFTPSERAVVVRLEELFRAAPQRSGRFVLFELDSSHSAGDRSRARGRAQSRIRRPQHGGQRRNRARPRQAAHSGRQRGAAAGYQALRSANAWWCLRAARRPSRCPRFRASPWIIIG